MTKNYSIMHISAWVMLWIIYKNPIRGQKIVPIHSKALMSPGDLRYHVWREVYANREVSDLPINGISFAVPMLDIWSYIQSNKTMFDNKAMHYVYNRSERAKLIISSIKQVQSQIHDEPDEKLGKINMWS